jgi:hypothetical protein
MNQAMNARSPTIGYRRHPAYVSCNNGEVGTRCLLQLMACPLPNVVIHSMWQYASSYSLRKNTRAKYLGWTTMSRNMFHHEEISRNTPNFTANLWTTKAHAKSSATCVCMLKRRDLPWALYTWASIWTKLWMQGVLPRALKGTQPSELR